MSFTQKAWNVFNEAIALYHQKDDVNQEFQNPYDRETDLLGHLLFQKNWIDTVQWHLEDIIRDPAIAPEEALRIKRWIDTSNQERTDMVEYLDSYFLQQYASVTPLEDAALNTESPAWAVDRFSILALKVYHMNEESNRSDASQEHRNTCQTKLNVLLEQQKDLATAIEQLLSDFRSGKKYMKVYKQMKMYNDESLNPILYGGKR